MPMKKLGVTLLLAGLATVLAVGCSNNDTKPVVTRLITSETCGVAPLAVEFRADASGGQPASQPTGGNSFLKIHWDFGDGTSQADGASVAFHTYAEPDTYVVSVTAEDDGGNVSPPFTRPIIVLGDTLSVSAYTVVGGELTDQVKPCEPITFAIRAHGCDFDPETGFYDRFLYTWTVDQPGGAVVYHGSRPSHSFPPSASGPYTVQLRIEDTGLALTRHLSFPVTVTTSAGSDLALSADWLDTPEVSPTLQITVTDPDTLTYSVILDCAGPEPGYGVRVHGRLPVNADIVVIDAHGQTGDTFEFSSVDSTDNVVNTFNWTVPEIAPGETHSAQIKLVVSYLAQTQDFWQHILAYPCDGNSVNNRAHGIIQPGK
jgi:PKD repeat protein